VALFGNRGAGKSSTLAWMAGAGCPPLADDLVVLDGLTAFAGPRSIDLWPEAAQALGLTCGARVVRGNQRRRLAPEAVPPALPLRAWVSLAWGPEVRLRALSLQERYPTLVEHLHVHRAGRVPAPDTLLGLLALPAFELTRPRRMASLPGAGAVLLELAGQLQQGHDRVREKTGAAERSG
jgi:hypothetical protein